MSLAVRAVLALAFLASLGVLWVMTSPIGRSSAISNSQNCYRALHYAPPAEAEVLVTGSSRIRRGLIPEVLAEHFGLGPNGVVNLGHPVASLAYDYAIVEELTRDRPIRLVLFEVMPRSPALERRERELDPGVIRDFHLIDASFNRLYVLGSSPGDQVQRLARAAGSGIQGSWNILRILSERVGNITTLIATRDVRKVFRVSPSMDKDRKVICMLDHWIRPDDRHQLGAERDRKIKGLYRDAFDMDRPEPVYNHTDFFTSDYNAMDRGVIEDMITLGEARGYRPVFFYLPSIHLPVDPEDISRRFEARFGHPILIPDPETRRLFETDGFYDSSHLNNKGRAIFTDWLRERLASMESQP
jgi:hypothetical protein